MIMEEPPELKCSEFTKMLPLLFANIKFVKKCVWYTRKVRGSDKSRILKSASVKLVF